MNKKESEFFDLLFLSYDDTRRRILLSHIVGSWNLLFLWIAVLL